MVGDLAGKSVDANLLLGSEQVFFSIDQVSSYPATSCILSQWLVSLSKVRLCLFVCMRVRDAAL